MNKSSNLSGLFLLVVVLMIFGSVIHGCNYVTRKIQDSNTVKNFDKAELDKLLFDKDEFIERLQTAVNFNGAEEENNSEGEYRYQLNNWVTMYISTYDDFEYGGIYNDKIRSVTLFADPDFLASYSQIKLIYELMYILKNPVEFVDLEEKASSFNRRVSNSTSNRCHGGKESLNSSEFIKSCNFRGTGYSSYWSYNIPIQDLVEQGYEVYKIQNKK